LDCRRIGMRLPRWYESQLWGTSVGGFLVRTQARMSVKSAPPQLARAHRTLIFRHAVSGVTLSLPSLELTPWASAEGF